MASPQFVATALALPTVAANKSDCHCFWVLQQRQTQRRPCTKPLGDWCWCWRWRRRRSMVHTLKVSIFVKMSISATYSLDQGMQCVCVCVWKPIHLHTNAFEQLAAAARLCYVMLEGACIRLHMYNGYVECESVLNVQHVRMVYTSVHTIATTTAANTIGITWRDNKLNDWLTYAAQAANFTAIVVIVIVAAAVGGGQRHFCCWCWIDICHCSCCYYNCRRCSSWRLQVTASAIHSPPIDIDEGVSPFCARSVADNNLAAFDNACVRLIVKMSLTARFSNYLFSSQLVISHSLK